MKASTQDCGMNCSRVKSSIALWRPKSSSNGGAVTTTRTDHTHHWDIDCLRPNLFSQSNNAYLVTIVEGGPINRGRPRNRAQHHVCVSG